MTLNTTTLCEIESTQFVILHQSACDTNKTKKKKNADFFQMLLNHIANSEKMNMSMFFS